ncbi:hypothetical protein L2E82_22655 [Cichorium intybus]|uniref:Uncharacterized protein n=1 Tax=Cichorium intybus TaxID=13427 RepID=A0ACB9DYM3_CICIN|nr:hypothetical protein L2E82_22655 [Cichorium intybus]
MDRIWSNPWIGPKSLKERYLALNKLDKCKSCHVTDRVTQTRVKWSWKKKPSDEAQLQERSDLELELSGHTPSLQRDSCVCELHNDGGVQFRDRPLALLKRWPTSRSTGVNV